MKNSEQLQKELKEQYDSTIKVMDINVNLQDSQMSKYYKLGFIDGELLTITTLKDCLIKANKSNISIEKFIGILEGFDQ